jgi:hypothetical protein
MVTVAGLYPLDGYVGEIGWHASGFGPPSAGRASRAPAASLEGDASAGPGGVVEPSTAGLGEPSVEPDASLGWVGVEPLSPASVVEPSVAEESSAGADEPPHPVKTHRQATDITTRDTMLMPARYAPGVPSAGPQIQLAVIIR